MTAFLGKGVKVKQWPRSSFAFFVCVSVVVALMLSVRPCSAVEEDEEAVRAERNAPEEDGERKEDEFGNRTYFPRRFKGYKVAYLNYEYYQTPFVITVWVFIATLAKIGFHMTDKLSSIFPESVLLIVLGIGIGILLSYTRLMTVSPLTPFTFFMLLLPPIVLDAGYFMPNRSFFDNLGTILLFAVIGTIFNTATIGVSLWAVGLTGLYGVEINVLDAFLFSALISAVDPVAVLAVFEEIHVNEVLYIVVFGESLLNDAVSLVLYNMFGTYTEMGEDNIKATDVALGVVSLFVVALGGTAIGIVCGFLTGFVTRFANHVRVVEPLIVFVVAYISYVLAQLFQLSGILAVTFCGICSKNYVEANISRKSHTTLKYAMKMLSSVSETIIFLFLGVATVNDEHDWNTWFVILTVFFCTIYRIITVVILTRLANHFRVHKLDKVEEFVMAYGGLRGAVAFALALTINEKVVVHKSMFITATIATVFFTVFVQGISIKPLVQMLRVKQNEKRKLTMNERIHEKFMDHLSAGVEEIVGSVGNHHLRDKFKYYDNHYLRKWLLRDEIGKEPKILETFSKLSVRDAKQYITQNGPIVRTNSMSPEASLLLLNKKATEAEEHNLNHMSLSAAMNGINLDIQELDYSPSTKDINDVRLHHLLKDSMFQTLKRHRRYSRTALYDEDLRSPNESYRRHGHNRRSHRKQSHRHEGAAANEKTNVLAVEDGVDEQCSYVKLNLGTEDLGCSYYNAVVDYEEGIRFSAQVHENGIDACWMAIPGENLEVFQCQNIEHPGVSTANADFQPVQDLGFLNMFASEAITVSTTLEPQKSDLGTTEGFSYTLSLPPSLYSPPNNSHNNN